MNFTDLTEEELDQWYWDCKNVPQLIPPEHNMNADIP